MERLNLNELASRVTMQEGGKECLSIAQVKEVQRLTFIDLADYRASEVMEVIERYKKD